MIRAMPIRPSLEPRGTGPRQRETTKTVAVLAIGRVLGTDNFLGLEEARGTGIFPVNRKPRALILMGVWCVSVSFETG